ncbi:MAG: hypothetical protein Q9222_002739 [Ikaeria aurantiellina]
MDCDVYNRKVSENNAPYYLGQSSSTLFDSDVEPEATLLDYNVNGGNSADKGRSINTKDCFKHPTDYSFQDNDSDFDEPVEEEESDGIQETHGRYINTWDYDNESESYEEEANDTIVPPPLVAGRKSAARALGRVRLLGGGELQWFDPSSKLWSELRRPAVYHTDIRHELIEDAARLGTYREQLLSSASDLTDPSSGYGWAQGKSEEDVTAFHPAYAENGEERKHWPKILFQYLPKASDFYHCKPGLWQTHDGRVVIDVNNDGMLDYPEIPVTLSWNTPAWLLVTMNRLNNHITMQDFRGRMPGARRPNQADPLGRNRISMNMTRWRKKAGCLSWNSIRDVDSFRDYLDRKLPPKCIRLNSTESFRELHAWEVAESMLPDAGKFLERSRAKKKVKSATKARQIYEKELKQVRRLKKTFDAEYDGPDSDNDDLLADKGITFLHAGTLAGTIASTDEVKKEVVSDAEEGSHYATSRVTKKARHSKAKAKPKPKPKPKPKMTERRVIQDTPPAPEVNESRRVCPRRHLSNGFLTKAPSSVEEAQLLYDLLSPSRIHYHGCTSTTPPETFGDECYKCQHADLQDAMNDWQQQHPQIRDSMPIKLFGLQYVDSKLFHWGGAWVMEWFGPRLPIMGGRQHNDGERVWD